MPTDSLRAVLVLVAAALAATLPSLLAYNVSPSPTFLNQALALGTWGGFALMLALLQPATPALRAAGPAQAALAVLALAVAASGTLGSLPPGLGLSALGLLAAASLLLHSGAGSRGADEHGQVFACFCWGWLLAGLLNLGVGLVQVFMPDGPDGNWISASNIVGRAVGNLRQPNHLSSLLVWSAITTVALLEMKRLPRVLGPLVLAALVLGVVLTASRTGLVSVCILALWGLADRRMSRPTRGLLLLAPVLYALAWYGMARWADLSGHTFGGEARLAETDVSGSRFGIWSNTVAMIKAQPWLGTGFGEFNLAWTLTPFPGRPTAFFDHTHNLPLQLAVELGLPLAALVLALLLWALARVARQAWRAEGPVGHAQRAALMFVVMIGLHSLLEYPLWYSYFLLPAAWALGYGLGRPVNGGAAKGPSASPAAGLPWLAPAAALLVAGAAYSVWDYTRVTAIFSSADTTTSLAQRIQRGQRSTFFGHHADYAAATTEVDARLRARAFDSATHFLLDTRLMMAWAEALAARGDIDRARHLADRLREFRNALSKDWFAACDAAPPPGQPEPFQCKPAEKRYSWRDFVPQR